MSNIVCHGTQCACKERCSPYNALMERGIAICNIISQTEITPEEQKTLYDELDQINEQLLHM